MSIFGVIWKALVDVAMVDENTARKKFEFWYGEANLLIAAKQIARKKFCFGFYPQ